MRPTTLCLLVKDGKVLLAMKKRGFGMGKWNGVGGKVEEGETIETAAIRETGEEIGIAIELADMKKVGNIRFHFKDKPEWNQHMHIFLIKDWKGEPKESEEMMPKWYLHNEIPFDAMWPDDKHWLPVVLAGQNIEGDFHFINEGKDIDEFNIRNI
jgi:8-oxo-dGTP pyrophosphatase MutT (NUDIX family)